ATFGSKTQGASLRERLKGLPFDSVRLKGHPSDTDRLKAAGRCGAAGPGSAGRSAANRSLDPPSDHLRIRPVPDRLSLTTRELASRRPIARKSLRRDSA